MSCNGVIRVGDVKTSLQLLVEDCLIDGSVGILNITNAADITVRFKRQSGDEEDVVGTIYTGGENGDGTDGIVEYITPDGFITEDDVPSISGIAIVTFDTTGPYHSSPTKFKVKSNF